MDKGLVSNNVLELKLLATKEIRTPLIVYPLDLLKVIFVFVAPAIRLKV